MYMADLGDEIYKDPYEFPTEDSQLWLDLLIKAKREDINFFFILYYLRSVGATLVKDLKFGYMIKPIVDRSGLHGWLIQKQFDEEKLALVPYSKKLVELLKTL